MNPNLPTCPACGGQVSPRAESCPHCGHPFVTKTRHGVFYYVFFGVVSLIATVVILSLLFMGGCLGLIGFGSYQAAKDAAERQAASNEVQKAEAVKVQAQKEQAEATEREVTSNRQAKAQYQAEAKRQSEVEAKFARDMVEKERRLRYIVEKAQGGDGRYQFELGQRYLKGDGVEFNINLARLWLRAACSNDVHEACTMLPSVRP